MISKAVGAADGSARWTVGQWLGFGFGMTACVVVCIAVVGFLDARHLASYSVDAERASAANVFAVERQVDHLKWVNDLQLHLLAGAEFRGQLDPTKCAFGKWLYSDAKPDVAADPELAPLIAAILQPHERLHGSARDILDATRQQNDARAKELFRTQTLPALGDVTAAIRPLREHYDTNRKSAADALSGSALRAERLLAAIGSLGILGALGIAWIVWRVVTTNLRTLAADVSDGAAQVLSAADQVATSAQSLSQGATEQAASLEEASASMEEMASMARRNAENARAAADLISDSDVRVEDSRRALDDMVQSMSAIEASSRQVARIIKAIDEIAFQTNILALNAAVEAARAGNAGMGFAVVADEVRSLAQRSAQAAKDTESMIHESITRTQGGSARVAQVATSFGAITDSVSKVKALVEDVSAASKQQALGVEQVSQAIAQMEKVTQTTAAASEESAAAGEELNAQAETSMNVVRRLERLVGGSARGRDAVRAVAEGPSSVDAEDWFSRPVVRHVPVPARRSPVQAAATLAPSH